MLGVYDNFPQTIHLFESYSTKFNIKQLQQKLIQTIKNMNRKQLHFEDIAIPTIPNSEVIFEFGLAEGDDFTFIDQEEESKVTELLKCQQLQMMDFFCAIRYYKLFDGKRIALKFDYYMIRSNFANGVVEFQIFHKQGPRYLSPQDLLGLIIERINCSSPKKILVRIESI